MIRVGIGTDKHRLVFGRQLVLGGVPIEFGKGAAGHSDGDCLLHAVIDALLGAAGLGDIGHHFPDNDPQWKDVDSLTLLSMTRDLLGQADFAPVNVDATIHLELPKLGRLKQEMSGRIADTLKIPRHCVNIKAKTGEGLDSVGKGDAIEALAVAQVETVAG